jgi:16S rRNA (guanine966-N2)-methyltransferase
VPDAARPTTDRVREAVFSALGDVTGASVLDLYAGSGALAIEALSRGAARALLVEQEARAAATATENVEVVGFGDCARVERVPVAALLARHALPQEAPFDLVFADPPYETDAATIDQLVDRLGRPGLVAEDGRIVLERPARDAAATSSEAVETVWQRTYGDTLVALLQPLRGH